MPIQDGTGTNVLIYFKTAQSKFKQSENNQNKPQNNTFSNGYFQMLHSRDDQSQLGCHSSWFIKSYQVHSTLPLGHHSNCPYLDNMPKSIHTAMLLGMLDPKGDSI
jgi:hypothetical protein